MLAQKRGRVVVPSRAIPTFVMFTDENYPSTVTVVDENDFNIQLGAALTSITLELTNAPITKGEVTKIPAVARVVATTKGKLHWSVPGVYSAYYPDFVSD